MSKTPWSDFAVGKRSVRNNWTNPDCQPLLTVSHVTHVGTSARVLEDETLRAGLVFDKSKLNTQRIRVVWLSPNDWTGAGGFRYGGLRLTYDFDQLVTGKKYYWVENIVYGIPACRILITDQDRSGMLHEYDPDAGDGPWWRAEDGSHHWNGEKTLEIMYEGDLKVEASVKADFVKHHDQMCCIDPYTCPERGWTADKVGGRVLAAALARRLPVQGLHMTEKGDHGVAVAKYELKAAFQMLLNQLPAIRAQDYMGLVDAESEQARALVRAVANALGSKTEVVALMKLFASREAFEDAACTVTAGRFEIDAQSLPFK